VLRGIGRQAGAEADFVWVRGTENYLRGRSGEAMNRLFVEGIVAGRDGAAGGYALVADELSAVEAALREARSGDTIVMSALKTRRRCWTAWRRAAPRLPADPTRPVSLDIRLSIA
jgi:hypothetical protein